MKLGKTYDQRMAEDAERKKRCGQRKRVFAFLPKWCLATGRYAWLEYVNKYEYYCTYNYTFFTRYEEIE